MLLLLLAFAASLNAAPLNAAPLNATTASLTPLNATVKSCGGTFAVKAVSLNPPNPVAGQQVGLHLEYVVPEPTVTGGTTQYTITYNFIPFQPTVEPLCQNVPCPLSPGAYSNDTLTTWPSGASGSFTSTMKWFDPSSLLLLCIEIAGKIVYTRDMAKAQDSKAIVRRLSRNLLRVPRT